MEIIRCSFQYFSSVLYPGVSIEDLVIYKKKCGILGQVWYLIASIPDLCPFTYFYFFLVIALCIRFANLAIENLSSRYQTW